MTTSEAREILTAQFIADGREILDDQDITWYANEAAEYGDDSEAIRVWAGY